MIAVGARVRVVVTGINCDGTHIYRDTIGVVRENDRGTDFLPYLIDFEMIKAVPMNGDEIEEVQ